MKRIISLAAAFAMLAGLPCATAFAAGASAEIYVTIVNADGELAVARETFTVTDTDGDGVLTVNDALYTAHEEKYSGGAAAGFGTSVTDYGLGITKLWGGGTGSGFGYYVNNASSLALTDAVKSGDSVCAFVYTDTAAFSDTYCYFDRNILEAAQGDSVTLRLSAAGFDENWSPVVLPVSGATIMIDGNATAYKTAADGTVTFSLADAGKHVISAHSDTQTLVPPVCHASVSADESETQVPLPVTGVESSVPVCALIGISALMGMAISKRKGK